VRIVLFVYAGYAVPAGVLLCFGGAFARAAAACILVAGAVSLLFALRRARGPALVLHLVLVPVQFVLSVPSNLPLPAMALSVAVVVAAKPGFPRLRPMPRKLILTLHIGLSVTWLGLATAMTALAATGLVTGDAQLRHATYRIMHIFDLVLVIPVVVLAIGTGLVLSLCTQWGLTRHWWVLTKFALSLTIPAVAGFQHLWIADLIARTSAAGAPGGLGVRLLVCFLLYDLTLWTATVLSVYKPGGRTPWSRPLARRRDHGGPS
jgi:hypothetical protein